MTDEGIRHHVAHVCICSSGELILASSVSSLCWQIGFENWLRSVVTGLSKSLC